MGAEARTSRIDCPDCGWDSREFSNHTEEIAAKVDAELHYLEVHGGRIPVEAPFGNKQCPECFAVNGMSGTVSCSECGHVPPEHREGSQAGGGDA
jgi:hypothetical protein